MSYFHIIWRLSLYCCQPPPQQAAEAKCSQLLALHVAEAGPSQKAEAAVAFSVTNAAGRPALNATR